MNTTTLYSFFYKHWNSILIGFIFIGGFFWKENEIFITSLFSLYLITALYNTYEKIQYLEGSRPHKLHFTTKDDTSFRIQPIIGLIVLLALLGFLIYYDSDYFGPFGMYYIIGLLMIHLWGFLYGKIPSAYFSLKDQILLYHVDKKRDAINISKIEAIEISDKKILINTISDKEISLLRLSLNEKEQRLILDYFKQKIRKEAAIIS